MTNPSRSSSSSLDIDSRVGLRGIFISRFAMSVWISKMKERNDDLRSDEPFEF